MNRDLAAGSSRDSASAMLAVLGLFGYGAVVVGFLFRIGGLAGLELALLLQAAALPVLFASAWATSTRRPALVPTVAVAPIVGVAAVVASTVGPRGGVAAALAVTFVVGLSVAGAALSWAVLGYVAGTGWLWLRRERVRRLEVLRSCSVVLAGTALTCVSYGAFWGYFVVGLGDRLA